MEEDVFVKSKNPIGRSARRVREILGKSQKEVAMRMDISTSALSQLENSETLRKSTVEKIAKALEVPADLIENFDEQTTLQIFTNCDYSGYNVSNVPQNVIDFLEKILSDKDKEIAALKEQLNNKP